MSGRPHDEHETLRELRKVMKQRRKIELLDRLDARRYKTQRRSKISPLKIYIHAEARFFFEAVGKVHLALRDKFRLLFWRKHCAHDPFRRLRRHDRFLL